VSGRPDRSELDLITAAKLGDQHAFDELVRRHREAVIAVVYRMCGDAHLAEDAAQEAFVRAWQHLPRYQPRAPFRNWVYRIALNTALDTLRAERQEPGAVDQDAAAPADERPEALVERAEQADAVRRAVLSLPPASRAVLVLREYEGLSYREIADTLDIPVGTVMSRLNYARERLRQALAAWLEGL
jgi:RNA polymerase sigma-70 factor (ECF subfamily)